MALNDAILQNPNSPEWLKSYVIRKLPSWFTERYSPDPTTPQGLNEQMNDSTSPSPSITSLNITGLTLPKVGAAYRQDQVKTYSYYNTEIANRGEGQIHGRSRRWGDVEDNQKLEIIDRIIEEAKAQGLDKDDTAMVLATAHHESGFNPDAAAGPSSAHGIGQFVNKTGRSYGLSDANRWDINEQIRALVEHFKDNKALAQNKGLGKEYYYALHHDGPSLAYGGIGISRKHVMPLYEMYRNTMT